MSAREISRRTGLTTRQMAHGIAELRDKGMTLPSCEGAQTGRGGPIGRGSGTSPSTGSPTTFGRPSASCHMTSKRLHNVARASGSHLRLRKSTAVRRPMAVSASSLWCISFDRIGPNWPYAHPPVSRPEAALASCGRARIPQYCGIQARGHRGFRQALCRGSIYTIGSLLIKAASCARSRQLA